jgi:hypothetical protein
MIDYAPLEWKPKLLLGHGNIENVWKPYAILLVFIWMFALILIWQFFLNFIDNGLAMGQLRAKRVRICKLFKEPRNRFPDWRAGISQPSLSYRPARLRRLAESFTNTGSGQK